MASEIEIPRAEGGLHYDEFGPNDIPVLERNIFGAVIQRAILDYNSTAKTEKEHRRSAELFLFHNDPRYSNLRLYAEYLFTNPDAFIERLRREVLAGNLQPKQVCCFTC